ncbi:MAG: hypothetical protein RMJ30_05655 [Nitrososphaerota archaeon]|nr:hypothetical protein [Nitrososphaerota archaeon]
MSPLGGGKKAPEELVELRAMIQELLNRLDGVSSDLLSVKEQLEAALRRDENQLVALQERLTRTAVEELRSMKEDLNQLFRLEAGVIVLNLEKVVDELRNNLLLVKKVQEYQDRMEEYLKMQLSSADELERAKKLLEEEREALKAELARLTALREATFRAKQELEERERRIGDYVARITELEAKKSELERQVRELEERHLKALEEASSRIERAFSDLDRRFRVREARLMRLSRLEESKREELARLEVERSVLMSYNEQFTRLVEEIKRLEARKEALEWEIKRLEANRKYYLEVDESSAEEDPMGERR